MEEAKVVKDDCECKKAVALDEPAAPLYSIHKTAVKTGMSDLAHQHDHYLYHVEKRSD